MAVQVASTAEKKYKPMDNHSEEHAAVKSKATTDVMSVLAGAGYMHMSCSETYLSHRSDK